MSTKITNKETGSPPAWWHPNGFKMELQTINPRTNPNHAFLSIGTSAASVQIAADDSGRTFSFLVYWKLIHSRGEVSGRIYMYSDLFAATFGMADIVPRGFESFVAKYGATTGAQGIFLRQGNYLSLPCPGTGVDGDPNISLYLTPEIKIAVNEGGYRRVLAQA